MSSVDIVIVNWNSGPLVLDCVNSIVEQKDYVKFINKIIIVDNYSSDNSIDILKGIECPEIELVLNQSNLGFGRACNIGANTSDAEFILFLNPDTLLLPSSLEDLNKKLINDYYTKRIGVMGAQLIDEHGSVTTTCSRFPRFLHFLAKSIGLTKLYPKSKIFNHHMTEFDHCSELYVNQVMGAFFLVSRKLFHQINGFDERFFVYFEEVDFCYRASQIGYNNFFTPDIKAVHKGCGTTESVKSFRLYLSISSRIKYFYKNYNLVTTIGVVLVTFSSEFLARLIKPIIRNDFKSAGEVLRAYSKVIKGFVVK